MPCYWKCSPANMLTSGWWKIFLASFPFFSASACPDIPPDPTSMENSSGDFSATSPAFWCESAPNIGHSSCWGLDGNPLSSDLIDGLISAWKYHKIIISSVDRICCWWNKWQYQNLVWNVSGYIFFRESEWDVDEDVGNISSNDGSKDSKHCLLFMRVALKKKEEMHFSHVARNVVKTEKWQIKWK